MVSPKEKNLLSVMPLGATSTHLDVSMGKSMGSMGTSMAGMERSAVMKRYDDYGTISNICDVVLGVTSRDEWMCKACRNTGEGEEGYPIPIDEKDDHEQRRCPKRMVTCAACDKKMKVSERLQHSRQCKGPVVVCNRCGAKVRKCFVKNHLKKCVPFGQSGSVHLRLDPQCTVTHLMEGGVACKGGMLVGDVIVKVTNPTGTVPVAIREDFLKSIGPRSEVFKGTPIQVHVMRDPEQIKKLRKSTDMGNRHVSTANIRKIANAVDVNTLTAVDIVMGAETVAARDNRRKRLETLRKVFPDINLEMIDEFMTDPSKCKHRVLEAFIGADEEGGGALDPRQMIKVFGALARRAGIEPPSEVDCMYAFREVNVDGNGLLTFDEFFPYLRCMIMEVVWAEGTLAPCPRCKRRTRERNQVSHMGLCCGDIHPRGSCHFDVNPVAPLEVFSVGPAAKAAGVHEGDILLAANDVELKSRSELARVCSPAKGVVAGCDVILEVQRRGTTVRDRLRLTMFPMPESVQQKSGERLAAACAKKLPKVSAETIIGLCVGGELMNATLR